jgi:hypothetical protein
MPVSKKRKHKAKDRKKRPLPDHRRARVASLSALLDTLEKAEQELLQKQKDEEKQDG